MVCLEWSLRIGRFETVSRLTKLTAKTLHGRETRQKPADTSSKLGELYELEVMARAAGVIRGPKVRGRTPGS